MAENGFIKIDRKILEWEWYSDINTFRLFMHCLLKANWKDGRFQGIEVPRGSFVTSLTALTKETGMTQRSVRTALEHLISTKEVTSTSYSKFRIITVNNYNLYQSTDKVSDKRATSERQATDNNRRKKESKEGKKDTNNNLLNESISILDSVSSASPSAQTPTPKKKDKTLEEALADQSFSDSLKNTLSEWLKYREQIKKPFKTTIGFEKLLTQVEGAVNEYGETRVINLINEGMSNGWQGIIFDRLKEQKGVNTNGSSKRENTGTGDGGNREEPIYGSYEWYRSVGYKED